MQGRYVLYGLIPGEHDEGNPDLKPDNQQVDGTIPLYATDDRQESITIYNRGGFIKDGKWFAVRWAEDTVTGNRIGNAPARP